MIAHSAEFLPVSSEPAVAPTAAPAARPGIKAPTGAIQGFGVLFAGCVLNRRPLDARALSAQPWNGGQPEPSRREPGALQLAKPASATGVGMAAR